ncbi:hypothetical protein ASG67_00710 [Sphingomonas sp. Leaf339]|uniref:M56 family metallopeptidase n=1 Tax=Sphingomonas sp. Leaf339 TaxID=1736343 RepID=UPI0006F2AE7C|nr:M56 family metallopeptidase [Sphingomonas sp. Leaf339]KQU61745.1 hypothetical protein ASG67_00710 [Sphingomonas sp. Leaf339]
MTGWAVEALIASAMLMAVVLLVRAPVRRLFGPQIAYALWALPMLRMVTPPLPADWREQAVMPISRTSEAVTVLILPSTAPGHVAAAAAAVEPAAAALPWGAMIAAAWLLGAGAFFLLHVVRHRQFCRRLLRDARTLDEIDGVRVIETAAAAGPLAFGTARRFVAFPDDFSDRYDADERELALAHELGHHARGDLIANWAALALLAVHWFNPLAWQAFRAFRCDQELANDARVLAGRSRTDRHIYACAIVKAAHGGAISAACHLHTITDLKGRLRMLTNTRLSRARLATGAAAVLGFVVTGLAVTASGTQAAAAITERVERATGVQIAAPAVPPAPVAPAAPAAPAPGDKTTKRVVIVKDGRSTTYVGADADRFLTANRIMVPMPPTPPARADGARPPLPPVPPRVMVMRTNGDTIVDGGHGPVAIRGGDCQPASDTETVIHRQENGRRVTVICNNRISVQADVAMRVAMASRQAEFAGRQAGFAQRQAAMAGREADRAAQQAAIAERRAGEAKASGLKQAIASIQTARTSIENNRNLTGEQRAEALAGLDEAMAEVRNEL